MEKLTMTPQECCEALHIVPDGYEPIQMSTVKFKALCKEGGFDWCRYVPMKQDEFLISKTGFLKWARDFFGVPVGVVGGNENE